VIARIGYKDMHLQNDLLFGRFQGTGLVSPGKIGSWWIVTEGGKRTLGFWWVCFKPLRKFQFPREGKKINRGALPILGGLGRGDVIETVREEWCTRRVRLGGKGRELTHAMKKRVRTGR